MEASPPSATTPPSPPGFDAACRRIEDALQRDGAAAALERLCELLECERRLPQLFEALLMRSRQRLGLPLIPQGSVSHLNEEVLRPHEDDIADACRKVGGLFLAQGDIVQAWPYFRALGENDPVTRALTAIEPGARRKDLEELADIAFHQGANPPHGLRLILASSGLCSAITAMERTPPATRLAQEECASILVRHIYQELVNALRHDLTRRGAAPEPGAAAAALPAPPGTLVGLFSGREWVFENGAYHADPSHLWAVVRLADALTHGPDLDLALELCDYGLRLAPTFHYQSEPPFERFYDDHAIYLRGRRRRPPEDAPFAREHFLAKARCARAAGDQRFPYGAVVDLVARLGFTREAAALFVESEGPSGAPVGCPSIGEMFQAAREFQELAEMGRKRKDLLLFTAGLVQCAVQCAVLGATQGAGESAQSVASQPSSAEG